VCNSIEGKRWRGARKGGWAWVEKKEAGKKGRKKEQAGPSNPFVAHDIRQNMKGTKTTVWKKVKSGEVRWGDGMMGKTHTKTPAKCCKKKNVKRRGRE
jgi:hypothetical protein